MSVLEYFLIAITWFVCGFVLGLIVFKEEKE